MLRLTFPLGDLTSTSWSGLMEIATFSGRGAVRSVNSSDTFSVELVTLPVGDSVGVVVGGGAWA